mmetsp:Transcript_13360/g.25078  ORF Transcript_13360/g.25078 Transcript_13360/m.25078 type:complete len:314 (+) Transcript_13360:353-1294(+)
MESAQSLHSFFRHVHLQHLKKVSYAIKHTKAAEIVEAYSNGISILSLAKEYNYPPTYMAKILLENITVFEKKKISAVLRDPLKWIDSSNFLVEKYRSSNVIVGKRELVDPFSEEHVIVPGPSEHSNRLAFEVLEAVNSDPICAPRFDKERQYIGMEFEIRLETALRAINIPFETENDLRAKGTSRTPDILFSYPVAVKVSKKLFPSLKQRDIIDVDNEDSDFVWKMICWIDSKALYGDVKTHNSSVVPQAEAYVHRFGPGLVLYWFGHAPIELLAADCFNDVIIMGWDIPKEFMLPTGHIFRDGFYAAKLNNL